MTDNHLFADPARENKGYAPMASLRAVLKAAAERALHTAPDGQPDALLFTGDVSNDNTDGSYDIFVSAVEDAFGAPPSKTQLRMYTPGNHDVKNLAYMQRR